MKKFFIFFIFFALWFVTPIPQYLELSTSFFASTAAVIILFYTLTLFFTPKKSISKPFFNFFVLLFILMLLHTIVVFFIFSDSLNVAKYLASILFFFIFLYSAHLFSGNLVEMPMAFVNKMLIIFFCILIFCAVVSLTDIIDSYRYPNNVFPYTEASHFALFFLPIYYYATVKLKKYRLVLILIGFLLALFIKNLTLVVGVVILASALYRIWALPLFPILIFLIVNNFELDYFTSRLDFSKGNDNLSTLVYVQGWELMGEALKTSHGFGVGFQQMGEVKLARTPAGKIIYMLTKEDYNIPDAGFTAAKLICEIGFLGIILIVFYLKIFVKCWIKLGNDALKDQDNILIFAICIIVSYFVELFVRGVGYFNPTTFLFLTALFVYNHYNKAQSNILVK